MPCPGELPYRRIALARTVLEKIAALDDGDVTTGRESDGERQDARDPW